MIRYIIIITLLALYLICGIINIPILGIIGKFSQAAKDKISYFMVSKTLKLFVFISGAEVEIRGFENIPKDRPVLFVGNHRSFFDIIISYSIHPPFMGFVAKKELKKIPLLAPWMRNMHCLFLDRSDPKEGLKMIQEGVANLNNGISMYIYPEGTRAHRDDEMKEFKAGSLKMAEKAKVPIVPVAINNTSAIWEDHFPKIKKAHVIFEYCEPIETANLDKEQKRTLCADVQNIIKEKISTNIHDIKY